MNNLIFSTLSQPSHSTQRAYAPTAPQMSHLLQQRLASRLPETITESKLPLAAPACGTTEPYKNKASG